MKAFVVMCSIKDSLIKRIVNNIPQEIVRVLSDQLRAGKTKAEGEVPFICFAFNYTENSFLLVLKHSLTCFQPKQYSQIQEWKRLNTEQKEKQKEGGG